MPRKPVLTGIANGVATITLARPEILNAIDVGLAASLFEAVRHADGEPAARAIQLTGAGRAFCAGGDVSTFDGAQGHAEVARRTIAAFHPAILRLATSGKPSVAAVHGAVAGAGVSLMLACDFAIAASGTRFSLAYSKIGATIDGGASWFLPRLVGRRKAKELALLSESLDAAAALDLGLVTQVVPAEDIETEALNFAARLAAGPSVALAAIKSLIDADAGDLARHLDAERDAFIRIAGSEDFAEGLQALRDKRAPTFRGR
ncbi:Enoyl-CoA hydratase [Rhizobiales bacterium GAS188]|nr:Enoyl-CoA hydratase [Rhizobiales bacterium GAS188]